MVEASPVRPTFDDQARIVAMIEPGSRVLDLGCGEGRLLDELRRRGCHVLGVDISIGNVAACIEKGIPVLQVDIDRGLPLIADDSFDVAVLNQTIQEVKRPEFVFREMLRVAPRGLVGFPNFAHWRNRFMLGLRGRMPMSRTLPFRWYDTPNIHLLTIKDFRTLCRDSGVRLTGALPVAEDPVGRILVKLGFANLGASRFIASVSRRGKGVYGAAAPVPAAGPPVGAASSTAVTDFGPKVVPSQTDSSM